MSRRGWFLIGGLLVSLVLAGVVSGFASSNPDGLEHAAQQGCTVDDQGEIVDGSCMAQAEQEHDLADSWFADYGIRGIENERLATGLSGVVGVLVTFAIGGGLFWLVRRRRPASAEKPE
ncbi:MAG TPA: PDGLE domain-containing protein [Natronosporangium sp.]